MPPKIKINHFDLLRFVGLCITKLHVFFSPLLHRRISYSQLTLPRGYEQGTIKYVCKSSGLFRDKLGAEPYGFTA